MESKNPVLEIEGVKSVQLSADGKCIITLQSTEYIEQIMSLKDKINIINDKILNIEKMVEQDNKFKKTRISDIENTLINERFDGILLNMELMLKAVLEEYGKEVLK